MESNIESAQHTIAKPFRVSVEGNIGAGKSTLITHFSSFPDVDAHMVSCYIKFEKCTLSYSPRDPPVGSQGSHALQFNFYLVENIFQIRDLA
jgi:deoxyadenosine/deoxycytidine kinase